jgi:predicted phage baseplate assembly protein
VAADVYLAFTLDDVEAEAALKVPAGTRAYSQPGPGETMQPFETSEALDGRPRWSVMRPRLTAPQLVGREPDTLYFAGTATGLAKGDTLLLELAGSLCRRVTAAAVEVLPADDRTKVSLDTEPELSTGRPPASISEELLASLLEPPALFTAGRERLTLKPGDIFRPDSYAPYGVLASAYPALRNLLGTALGGLSHPDRTGSVTIYAMRVKAALHGHNASFIPDVDVETGRVERYVEWNSTGTGPAQLGDGDGDGDSGQIPTLDRLVTELDPDEIALDAMYNGVLPGSYVVLDPPAASKSDGVHRVTRVRTTTRSAFHLPARVTVLQLADFPPERDSEDGETPEDRVDRKTVVYAQSEPLDLAELPIAADVCDGVLELDGYYPGLQPGRRVIVTGERTQLVPEAAEAPSQAVTGVPGTELVMISSVEHRIAEASAGDDAQATGETLRTVLEFAEPRLQYCYRRTTVRLLGNVAHATHGESRAEVLGGGDATRPLQTFPLRQGPLTYLPAPTTTGTASTLDVRVEDLRWSEAPHAAAVLPGERRYVLRAEDDGTRVTFGLGARLPTGQDNVRALYRSGIGANGNARAGQVSVLASRPNGVTGVTNPLPAAGGADRDGLESIRERVPIGLTALDRLVSAGDLQDFTRAFAGIGKAQVSVVEGPPAEYVVTVAAVDDAPLTAGSALLGNLRRALARFGDLDERPGDPVLHARGTPPATVAIRVRTALLLGIRARIRIEAGQSWEFMHPRLRAALLAVFGFRTREIGQVPYPGEAMAVMQAVRGVAWVDLLAFGTLATGTPEAPRPPEDVATDARALFGDDTSSPRGLPDDPVVPPEAIAYLSPAATGTLLLEQAAEEERA